MRSGWVAGFTAAVVAGIGLRAYRCDEQVLTGDELHAINGALSRSLGEILRQWTYHGADYSVPLTALYRLGLDAGLAPGEMTFRSPALAAGVVLLIALPLVLRRRIGPPAALVLAWLLALSPLLVLYGRMVRSYAPMVLCATGALLCFERWWETRSRRAGLLYAGLASLAVYLHLGAASFVLAPLLYGAVSLGLRRRGVLGDARRLAILGLATGALILVLLWPARESLVALAGLHGEGRPPSPGTLLAVGRLHLGTSSVLLAVALATAACRGTALLSRSAPGLLRLVGVAAVVHLAGLLVLQPNFLEARIVVTRYLLPLLPFLLVLVAVGLGAPLSQADARLPRMQGLGVALVLLAAFLTGPLARAEYRWSSFTHAQPSIDFLGPGDRMAEDAVPAFYGALPAGDEALVEVPWTNVGTHSFSAYQRVHRRPLVMASLNRQHTDPRLALRNLVPARPDDLRASGARYVVVHLDLRQEELQVQTRELRHHERLEKLTDLWQVLRRAGRRIAGELRERWGPPVYQDPSIMVWDLQRLEAGP
jgi:hypothetical protein